MASKKENIELCDKVVMLANRLKDNIVNKSGTGFTTIEIEGSLIDIDRMLGKLLYEIYGEREN